VLKREKQQQKRQLKLGNLFRFVCRGKGKTMPGEPRGEKVGCVYFSTLICNFLLIFSAFVSRLAMMAAFDKNLPQLRRNNAIITIYICR